MDVKQKKEFQREMKTIIIPALEKMIESEKKHIEDLKIFWHKACYRVLIANSFKNVRKYTNESYSMLKHYELRLKQYKEFVDQEFIS